MNIRQTLESDIANLQTVLDLTGLFPSELLPEMIGGYLSHPSSDEIWLSCLIDEKAIGLCYAKPEMLTDGTWNMLAIAAHPDIQGSGVGSALAARLEADLRANAQRLLIADTSGTEAFAQTRAFYVKNGYTAAASIPGFWGEGDDKVTFWKSLK